MKTVEVRKNLIVTSDMHEKVNGALKQHTKCQKILTWEEFTSKKVWQLIPNIHGEPYKAQILIHRDNEQETVRLHHFLLPDERDVAGPKPHNHPWDFIAYILDGGYVEERWIVAKDRTIKKVTNHFNAGDQNKIKAIGEYHEIVSFKQVPTWSLMVAGPVVKSQRWGYLDLKTRWHIEAAKGDDPNFKRHKARLNA